jgi:hypothetical protein
MNCQSAASLERASADSISTPPRAADDVFGSLDRDVAPEDFVEDFQFRAAEAEARGGRDADRAVVFDQQEVAIFLWDDFRHVAFLGADLGQNLQASA